jgi:hypothetical protein
MNELCADIGYQSLNKHGEYICGDHIELVDQEDGTQTIVLADGLGSGVKANILSTLTSKIISTMISEGMSISDCVKTIANTLPVCQDRAIAYSTFTIIRIINSKEAEVIQYDNPNVILLRNGESYEFFKTEMNIEGKRIFYSRVALEENDIFIAMSDGCIHAGVGMTLNFGWERSNIIEYMKTFYDVGYTAKTLTKILLDKCNELYCDKPGDDTTACIIRIRKREPLNLVIGPPANMDDTRRMMSLFFAKAGKHIVCGGTTSQIAANYLDEEVITTLNSGDPNIPPTGYIDGVDLVTEGVITINKVLEYANDYLANNDSYEQWCYKKDGASLVARMLFEDATDINFYVGRAINPAHQNPDLPINFNIKMQLVGELSECLKKMGKRINTSYF